MDAISDRDTHQVVIMAAAQVAKTEIILNALGYVIHLDPGPTLFIVPKDAKAREFSTERLAPMLRDTPALRDKIDLSRTRDSSNTILEKDFPGGHLSMCGANVPSNLASRPIKYLFADEADRLDESAGTEGDPLDLAIVRTKTFTNRGRKIVICSSPTIAGLSRVEAAFAESDQRYFLVPCHACGHFQELTWSQVRFENRDPNTALYECVACQARWSDTERRQAVRLGHWEAAEPFDGIAGFHISELYSPFTSLSDVVKAFLAAKDSRSAERMKVWTNTSLGQVWEDDGTTLDESELATRVEPYAAEVPFPVCILTAGVDVQDDRLEVEVIGWNQDEESWGIAKEVLLGDPGQSEVWKKLDATLFRKYQHESGIEMRIQSIAVDTGGHFTQATYTYCKLRRKNGVHAIKGRGGFGVPFVGNPSRNNRANVALFLIGVDPGKESIANKLSLDSPGPGYCHFPNRAGYNEEFFRQLTAERLVTRYTRGVRRREWVKLAGRRNEAFDCRVYAYAALYILNPDLPAIAENFRKRLELEAQRVEAQSEASLASQEPAQETPISPPPEPMKRIRELRRRPRPTRPVSIRDRIRGW